MCLSSKVPEHFFRTVEATIKEFHTAIQSGKDSEKNWKQKIYPVINQLDQPIPHFFIDKYNDEKKVVDDYNLVKNTWWPLQSPAKFDPVSFDPAPASGMFVFNQSPDAEMKDQGTAERELAISADNSNRQTDRFDTLAPSQESVQNQNQNLESQAHKFMTSIVRNENISSGWEETSTSNNNISTTKFSYTPRPKKTPTTCGGEKLFPPNERSRSHVWEFGGFKKGDNGDLDKTRLFCGLCSHIFSFRCKTSNFWKHLRTCHSIHLTYRKSSIVEGQAKRARQSAVCPPNFYTEVFD